MLKLLKLRRASFLFLFIVVTSCSVTEPSASNSLPPLVMQDADKTLGSIEIYDERALTLLSPKTKVSVRAEGYRWVEGPVWIDEGQYVLYSDIPNNEIRKYSPVVGESTYLKNSGYQVFDETHPGAGSNGLLLSPEGELVLLQHGERQVGVMKAPLSTPKADYKTLANNYEGKKLNSPNDGVYDAQGRLFFTDPPYGIGGSKPRKAEQGFNGIYRIEKSGDIRLLDTSVTLPNGIAFSPDYKTLYVSVSDPKQPQWLAYDVNALGEISNKRNFYTVDKENLTSADHGLPDGMVVHSSGVIFSGGPGGIWVFDTQGVVLAKIKTGLPTSNCTFTTNEEYLFITAGEKLLSVPLKY